MRIGQAEASANALVERARDEAFAALDTGQREAAGLTLWTALQQVDAVADDDVRRVVVGRLGTVCAIAGFDDLALLALEPAVALHGAAGDARALENDGLTLGNVHQRLGNFAAAEAAWTRAYEVARRNGDDANAASAATNRGTLLGQAGYLERAIELLEQSLAHLAREPFPETELNTRFALAQMLDVHDAAAARVLDAAQPIGAWHTQLAPPYRARLTEVVERALAERPERRAEFGWLLGAG